MAYERDHIGEYVARISDNDPMGDRPLTKYHLVESKIEDRYVIRCGRQMASQIKTQPRSHLVFAVVPPEGQRCERG